MLNKTKGFLSCLRGKWIFSYDFGMKHGCGKSWCKQPLHKTEHWKNILWGHGQGMPCSFSILPSREICRAR